MRSACIVTMVTHAGATLRPFGESGLRDFAGDCGETDAAEALQAARETIGHGITLFDTAESYGPYISEELLGKALGARRKEIVLVTKVGFKYEGNRLVNRCSSFDHVITAAEGCLRRLGTSPDERQEVDTIFAEERVPTHSETSQITEPFLPAR